MTKYNNVHFTFLNISFKTTSIRNDFVVLVVKGNTKNRYITEFPFMDVSDIQMVNMNRLSKSLTGWNIYGMILQL